jgi:sugar lactone lactonase YvrE
MRADRLTGVVAFHGEGPVWWPEAGLRICDVYAGDILTIDTSDGRVMARSHVGDVVGAFRPRSSGGVVAGTEDGFCLVDPSGSVEARVPAWNGPGFRMNDGACDWNGDFICGRLKQDEPREGAGVLYRLGDPAMEPAAVLVGQGIPNGLVFDASSSCAYYIDTLTRCVQRFDIDDAGNWVDGRVSIDLTDGEAYPDGMAVDSEGCLWIAMWGAGTVNRYRPGSSEVLEKVEVPGSTHVTAVTFGGADLGTLFITTSGEGPGRSAIDGSVFAATPGVVGVLPHAYRH